MTGREPAIRYESEIVGVGAMVEEFVTEHGILVLFAAHAPVELHEISVQHRALVEVGGPAPGDIVDIGERSFPVLAVGPVVERNLLDLGHIDFKADGATVAELRGDVCVPVGALPVPEVGAVFRITRPAS